MAASAGIGASTTFSVFTGLDAMGAARGLEVPTGDFRLVADLDAAAIDGPWAWAPADLCDTEGAPWPTCSRTFARRMERRVAERGFRVEASFETEFTVWDGDGRALHEQPAYGLEATRAAGPFLLALVRRLRGPRRRGRPGAPGVLARPARGVGGYAPGRSPRPTGSCWCAT